MFLFLRGRTCVPFLLRAYAGRVTFLATFCFVYPPYEVAMPCRQNVRNAQSRALRALETPAWNSCNYREHALLASLFCAIPCMLGVATKYCQILYFATCFCFVLALLLALSFSFLIALLTNFSSGVSNALKALGRTFLTFCLLGIATSYGG